LERPYTKPSAQSKVTDSKKVKEAAAKAEANRAQEVIDAAKAETKRAQEVAAATKTEARQVKEVAEWQAAEGKKRR
jgi:hypothetical protein